MAEEINRDEVENQMEQPTVQKLERKQLPDVAVLQTGKTQRQITVHSVCIETRIQTEG